MAHPSAPQMNIVARQRLEYGTVWTVVSDKMHCSQFKKTHKKKAFEMQLLGPGRTYASQ